MDINLACNLAWLKQRANDSAQFRSFFERLYGDSYEFLRTKLIAKMSILEALYMRQCLCTLDGLLAPGGD